MPLEKSISRTKQKGRFIPSHYMQSVRNFVADKNPIKKDPNKSYNVTKNRVFAWRWLFWERCLKEKKLQRSLGYQLTHKLQTPWQRKECLHLRSWGLYLSQKSPLFNVVTLYFLLQNLCPTEMKRKRRKHLRHAGDLPWYSLEKGVFC